MCLLEEELKVVRFLALKSKLSADTGASRGVPLVTLKRNKEFGFAYRKGNGTGTKILICICAKSKVKGLRVGFVVSAKVGNAVVRNLVRRRLREAYRKLLPMLSGNYSIVFVAKAGINERRYDALVGDMKYLLKKQGILCGDAK